MKVAEATRWVRRFLRDPEGHIWSDGLIFATLTESQSELQATVGAIVEIRALSVPPQADYGYMFDFERDYIELGRTSFRALRDQGGYFSFVGMFEVHAFFENGSNDDTNDSGIAWTAPWEAWTAVPNEPPLWQLPDDFCEMKMLYYNERPIAATTRQNVLKTDSSYKTREGEPTAFYFNDDVSRQISVYPKPSTAVNANSTGSGMTLSTDTTTESTEIGTITRIEGRYTSSGVGMTIDTIDAKDQILLVYEVSPRDIEAMSDDFVFPDFMVKYICYLTLSKLYGMNTDGRIPTLARFWRQRYKLGIDALNSYTANKRANRLVHFTGPKSRFGRRKRLPRLPDKFPATYP